MKLILASACDLNAISNEVDECDGLAAVERRTGCIERIHSGWPVGFGRQQGLKPAGVSGCVNAALAGCTGLHFALVVGQRLLVGVRTLVLGGG